MDKHIPILLTAITALLYVVGVTYYDAYLLSFGLNKSQFPLSVDLVFFHGFVSSVMLGLDNIKYFYFSAMGVVFVAIAGTVVFKVVQEHRLLNYIKLKLGTKNKENLDKADSNSFIEFSFKIFEIMSGVIIVFLLLILVILSSIKAGEESAVKFAERCEQESVIKTTIRIKGEDKLFVGCTIACNSTQCAYQDKSRVAVINNDKTLYAEIQQ